MENYYDKNDNLISMGDHVVPDEGRELVITGEAENGLLGTQVVDPTMVSLLTQGDLSRQWTLVASGES